ncbi:MAG TPA: proliferating cell nuclear antigen (pcna) [Candidatus Pacearchaeota archaeon]|nr:DNA polymerase sliding clamp [archaeon BMS3Abin17]HDK42799.1 proliferating cell nuclear antigen (pcna) [Candidatus Pacearchaeota archaeon]HDZ60994.1 proliferating cell nuclear antigen (pcna) [Candidatus Pacearchaeota archaeon]
MLVKLDNPILLSKAVEIISELVTEVRIKVNEFGMSITAMDPANVAMIGFRLPKASFSQFETGEESLGINLDSLKQILKRGGAGSSLILEKKENMLNIQIQDRIKRNFNLSLIDIEGEEKEMPNLEFSSRVELDSVDLVASIEDCGVVADACSFIIQDGKFIIEAKGLNSARSEFSGDEAKIQAENCKSRYSLEYLQKFIKGSKLSEKTILNFANDHPLKMDIKTQHMGLSFILAPRVETDD